MQLFDSEDYEEERNKELIYIVCLCISSVITKYIVQGIPLKFFSWNISVVFFIFHEGTLRKKTIIQYSISTTTAETELP